ncbi:hypothetical protein KJ806_01405, partial [Patescibacteria group bacterium]|nr:hypothetical protein [Patescibacteria group bacterium]
MLYQINSKNKKLVIAGLAVFFIAVLFAWTLLPVNASSVDSAVTSSDNQAANNSFWSFSGLYQKIVDFVFPNNSNKKYTELDVKKKNIEIESVNLDIQKKKAEVELAITKTEKEKAEAELATLEIKKKNVEIEQAIVKTEAETSNIKKQIIEVSPAKVFVQETKIIREMPINSDKQETKIIRETIIANNNVSGNFTIRGNSKVDGDLNVGGLVKLGSADLMGDLYNSQGDLIVNDNLVVKSVFTTKALQVLNSADFGGGVNAKDIDSENISVGKKLTVSGNSTIQGSEQISGSLRVGGTFSAGHAIFSSIGVDGSFGAKSISSSGNLVVGGKTQLNGESVDIKGNVNVANGLNITGSNLTVGNNNFIVDANGNLTISGVFTASSSQAYFGAGSFVSSSTSPMLFVNQTGSGPVVDFKKASTSVFYINDIGAITLGVWNGTTIGAEYGGTGLTSYTKGDLLIGSGTTTLEKLAIGLNGKVLTASSTAIGGISWEAVATTTGITNHSLLSNLDYATSGHTGFEPTVTKGNLTEATSSILTIIGGISSVIGAGVSIQVNQSSGFQSGYLLSTDWNTFNSKESALTFSGPLSRNANIVSIATSTALVNGFLTSTDWAIFNSKESVLSFSGPLSRNANAISIATSTASTGGFLTSTDWITFDNKIGPVLTEGSILVGDSFGLAAPVLLSGDATISNVGVLTITKGNLTEATSSILTITGGTSAIIGAGASIQVKQASSSQNGFLSSADWSTFNSKESALTFTGPLAKNANIISIATSTASINGFLTSADWTTFNSKIGSSSLSAVNNLTYSSATGVIGVDSSYNIPLT